VGVGGGKDGGKQKGSLIVESARGCGLTPPLLGLLEELSVPYELVPRPDGYFLRTYGRSGPRLVDGDLTLFEVGAMLRHCARTRGEGRFLPQSPRELARVDAWLELASFLAVSAFALLREEREQGTARRPQRIGEERVRISAIIETLERALDDSDGDWLLGDFGLADCALVSLPLLAGILDFGSWPRVRAYSERLASRPAARRAQAFARAQPAPSLESSSCSSS